MNEMNEINETNQIKQTKECENCKEYTFTKCNNPKCNEYVSQCEKCNYCPILGYIYTNDISWKNYNLCDYGCDMLEKYEKMCNPRWDEINKIIVNVNSTDNEIVKTAKQTYSKYSWDKCFCGAYRALCTGCYITEDGNDISPIQCYNCGRMGIDGVQPFNIFKLLYCGQCI